MVRPPLKKAGASSVSSFACTSGSAAQVGADNFTLTAGGNQHQLDHAGFALAAVNGGQPAYRNAVEISRMIFLLYHR